MCRSRGSRWLGVRKSLVMGMLPNAKPQSKGVCVLVEYELKKLRMDKNLYVSSTAPAHLGHQLSQLNASGLRPCQRKAYGNLRSSKVWKFTTHQNAKFN